MWSFATETEFQRELDWIADFVRTEIEPLDHLLGHAYDVANPDWQRRVRPLQAEVKKRGLWACHLGPHLGGKGYGQLKLALMNEQFGRSRFGPIVFGCQAPDTGNSEILAHYGTDEQKARYLAPLLANDTVSCFAMTEPQGGADPLLIRTTATRTATSWKLDGEKWFATNAPYASFYLVMAMTDPEAEPHQRFSIFIVPADRPGIEIVHNYGFYGEPEAAHGHVRFNMVDIPHDHLLGEQGDGFTVAQVRLSGGRMHHAMRSLAEATKCFDLLCERVLSRFTKGEQLARKQMVQEKIADCWIQLRQFRLLILETAWLADQSTDWRAVRKNVSAVKAIMPKVLHDIAATALHLHGAIGISTELPFADAVINSFHVGLADGPTEVHKVTVAREVLKGYSGKDPLVPNYQKRLLRAAAEERYH